MVVRKGNIRCILSTIEGITLSTLNIPPVTMVPINRQPEVIIPARPAAFSPEDLLVWTVIIARRTTAAIVISLWSVKIHVLYGFPPLLIQNPVPIIATNIISIPTIPQIVIFIVTPFFSFSQQLLLESLSYYSFRIPVIV